MHRRTFLTLVGGVAGSASGAAAMRDAKAATRGVGFLVPTTAATARDRIETFSHRLGELGWKDGSTVALHLRYADGRPERFSEAARELVRLDVGVIATWGTPTVAAVKRETVSIPIVFALVSDPVGSGFVASLARPGGNLTGLSTQHIEAAGKRLEILREIMPQLRRLAILFNAGNPVSVLDMREADQAARALGLEVGHYEFKQADDIPLAFSALKNKADALLIAPDALVNTNRDRIAALALDARLPTMHGFSEPVVAGSLMSYGPNYLDMFRRTAEIVDKILRGAKPDDIPVEQPRRFDLVINLKTAKALGLTVPLFLQQRADEVIE
jgi:putative ABC transport system substrate-binding protein